MEMRTCSGSHSCSRWRLGSVAYEAQSTDKLSDMTKSAVLSSNIADEKIREHLALNAARLETYDEVRAEIAKIIHARRKWTSVEDSLGVPMEVDAIGRGKGDKALGDAPKSFGAHQGHSLVARTCTT